MATRNKKATSPASRRPAEEQLARLRAEVARLRAEIRVLKGKASRDQEGRKNKRPQEQVSPTPPLPPPDAQGNYPAAATLRALLAQQIIRRREAAGWTQAELAARARVRQETVSRLETGKNAPNVATVDKLDRALKEAGF
jgi:ribosome-binding protein aMBF1 (putative translation factor)